MGILKKLLKGIGPGFVTGASDDDPTAIATYAQSGGQFGYKQLWTALFAAPFMIVVQEMCGRIGMVTGKGLGAIIPTHYSRPIVWTVLIFLFIANTVTIGADLGAMAAAGQLLWHIPFFIWLTMIAVVIVALQIFVPYKTYSTILKYSTLAFLAYILSAFLVKQNWREIVRYTFIPFVSLQKDYLLNVVAILGTNISPYLFFWQANQEVEDEVEERKIRDVDVGRPVARRTAIRKMRADTMVGMVFSNIIVYFIEMATAATLGSHGVTTISTPSQAALAIRPFAGEFAFLLFAIGILGSGFLAVPALSAASTYALCETYKWKTGLHKKFFQAPFFYLLLGIFTMTGIAVNFLPIKPFDLLVYAAALDGILTPVLLIVILGIANNKKIMESYTNSLFSNIAGWVITFIMGIAALVLIFTLFLAKK